MRYDTTAQVESEAKNASKSPALERHPVVVTLDLWTNLAWWSFVGLLIRYWTGQIAVCAHDLA